MSELKTIDAKGLDTAEELTPMAMISQAVASGADVEIMAQLMTLQERWEANQAKRAFVDAMTAFKRNPPSVFKNAEVDFSTNKGRTHYKHASLDNVCNILNKALAEHGLSFRWETENLDQGIVRVTCILTHELGHSERVMLQASGDQSGGKNNIQAVGSTVTYLQRYTLLAATGIAVQGQDDDGRAQREIPVVDGEGFEEMKRLFMELDADDKDRFLKLIRAETIEDARALRQDAFDTAMARLRGKVRGG